jgi:hypothetical protein
VAEHQKEQGENEAFDHSGKVPSDI